MTPSAKPYVKGATPKAPDFDPAQEIARHLAGPARGAYIARAPGGGTVVRPTRNAAGMTATDARRKLRRGVGDPALKLAVRGTYDRLDALAHGFHLKRLRCECCGGPTQRVRLAEGKAGTLRAVIQEFQRFRPRLP